ncbi:MAG: Nitrogenase [Oscillospiraceae bacterium]|nr:Nitrogenase [Oscillospiraceae bacterium]
MSLSLMMAATISRSVIILHGPIGCGANLTGVSSAVAAGRAKRGPAKEPVIWLSSNMRQNDVIGGGESGLRETIRYADREFRPEIIFVISTCAPNIIGDDVEDVVESMHDEVTADLTAIHCPGFKSRVVASAYDSFYHSLIRHISFEPEPYRGFTPYDRSDRRYEPAQGKRRYEKSRTVNLFNATSINADDECEIVRLLGALDLKVRIFAEYSSRDELRSVSEAALNVSMCNVHDDYILKYLEETYRIPYLIEGMPLGTRATRAWLTAIARFFGREEQANLLCDQEENRLNGAIQEFLPKLKGKRVLVGGGVIRVAEEARLLNERGLEVLSVRAYHFDSGALPVYEELAEELPEIPISVSNQVFEEINQLKRHRPDIVVDHAGKHGWIAKAGIPSVNLFTPARPFFGYIGEYALLKSIVFHLENPSFSQRLSRFVKLPYQDSWFERDAFSYIQQSDRV